MRPTEAHAPIRIDLAGGTLDIAPIHLALAEPAVTVNVALDLPCRAIVRPRPDGAIEIASRDLGRRERHADLAALEDALRGRRSRLDLLARAVAWAAPDGGLTLETHAVCPPGAGLGASSSVAACALAALLAARGEKVEDAQVAQVVQDLEAASMRAPTGYQDVHPPLAGGCLALEARPGGVRVEALDVDLEAMARRLRLVYTGEPHVSGITNWGTLRSFLDRETTIVDTLEAIAQASRRARQALRAGDLDQALAAVVAEGRLRRDLGAGVETPTLRTIDETTRAAGALGTKICGAGGGGSILVLLPDPGDAGGARAAAAVDAAIADLGHETLPAALTAEGLVVAPAA